MNLLYFEDIEAGIKTTVGQHQTSKAEIVNFASKWDRQPFHLDEKAAKNYPYGGLIAPAPYILAVVTKITTSADISKVAAIGILEYEHVRIVNPVRPGDLLTLTSEPIEKRESKTKPDRGIVRYRIEIINQNDELVLSYVSANMIYKRPREAGF